MTLSRPDLKLWRSRHRAWGAAEGTASADAGAGATSEGATASADTVAAATADATTTGVAAACASAPAAASAASAASSAAAAASAAAGAKSSGPHSSPAARRPPSRLALTNAGYCMDYNYRLDQHGCTRGLSPSREYASMPSGGLLASFGTLRSGSPGGGSPGRRSPCEAKAGAGSAGRSSTCGAWGGSGGGGAVPTVPNSAIAAAVCIRRGGWAGVVWQRRVPLSLGGCCCRTLGGCCCRTRGRWPRRRPARNQLQNQPGGSTSQPRPLWRPRRRPHAPLPAAGAATAGRATGLPRLRRGQDVAAPPVARGRPLAVPQLCLPGSKASSSGSGSGSGGSNNSSSSSSGVRED